MKYMLSFQCATQEEAQAVLSAVAAIGKQPHACSRQYIEPSQLSEKELSEIAAQGATSVNTAPYQRKNVSPGEPSITKIGMNTEGALFGVLRAGGQPEAKYAEHLKLLWKRGKVKFDGKEYYV